MTDEKDAEQAAKAVERMWEQIASDVLQILKEHENREYATAEEVAEWVLERKEVLGTPEEITLLRKLFLENRFEGTIKLVVPEMTYKEYGW